MRESLGLGTDEPIPKFERPQKGLRVVESSTTGSADDATQPKRKQPPDGEDVEMVNEGGTSSIPEEASKRPKKGQPPTQPTTDVDANGDPPAEAHARAAAAYIPFLTAEMLMPPKMPTSEEMEKVLLDLRKRALVDEYFGEEGS